jgi:hypothetical protein
MLHELHLEYDDGRTETKLIHTIPGEQITIYPQRDNIKHSWHKVFKYVLPKHNLLTKAIVKFGDKYVIMPHGIECHPKTTMDDIVIVDEPIEKPPKIKEVKVETESQKKEEVVEQEIKEEVFLEAAEKVNKMYEKTFEALTDEPIKEKKQEAQKKYKKQK